MIFSKEFYHKLTDTEVKRKNQLIYFKHAFELQEEEWRSTAVKTKAQEQSTEYHIRSKSNDFCLLELTEPNKI